MEGLEDPITLSDTLALQEVIKKAQQEEELPVADFFSSGYNVHKCALCLKNTERFFTIKKDKLVGCSEEEARWRQIEEANNQGFAAYQRRVLGCATNTIYWVCKKCGPGFAAGAPRLPVFRSQPLWINEKGDLVNWAAVKPLSLAPTPMVPPPSGPSSPPKYQSSYEKLREKVDKLEQEKAEIKARHDNEVINLRTQVAMEQINSKTKEDEITRAHVSIGKLKEANRRLLFELKNSDIETQEKAKEILFLRDQLDRERDFVPQPPRRGTKRPKTAEEKREELAVKKRRAEKRVAEVLEEGRRAVDFMNTQAFQNSWREF